ncbi:SDR family oxidoreductase [Elizabethkingia ursingii]|uniref:SDR family NAD(P)-dependent oxidoreductase n=1 Tax=Elizabethkingia ursingii TaxID=1756150 RepID=UPI0020130696|nr:SDR family NAD(P)-dependent oxidoreductase [Elizabethkingia ursingii]MCL1668167.1 SDR family oxidoreductase [Elizabethkingia ursingii]
MENKVAIVTGAGSGIGRAIALKLGQSGARIVVSDIQDEGGQQTVKELHKMGASAIFVKADISKLSDHEALVAQAVKHFGMVQIAVNNAGIGGPFIPVESYSPEDWNRIIDINLTGTFYGLKTQIPAIKTAGGGSIVNVASIAGILGVQLQSAYTASKHGVVGLTKSAALDCALDNIRINAVCPGTVITPLVMEAAKALQTTIESNTALWPMRRPAEPSEIAELVAWLCSDKASYVTGVAYPIDGGMSAS